MRKGKEYVEALRDERKVWVAGEGRVDDVTSHPATCALVEEYAAWYDRHFDPAWQEVLLTTSPINPERSAVAFLVPTSSADLRRMGRSYAASMFVNAGNITHTPAYGNLVAIGIVDAVQRYNPSAQFVRGAQEYREGVALTGRFVTFAAGIPPVGYRLRGDSDAKAAMRLVKETDAGIVVSGKIGMHTAVPFADEVYVGSVGAVTVGDCKVTYVVPVAAPGVTVVCRKVAARHPNSFMSPLSSRFDELDAQIWLENVFIPWERVFWTERQFGAPEPPLDYVRGMGVTSWLFWYQLYCWLSKAKFTLGLALACADAIGQREDPQTIEHLTDLVAAVQTVSTCITAAEMEPELTQSGYCIPGLCHIAVGTIAMLNCRQRMAEILRILAGSSLLMAPADTDLEDAEMAAGFEDSFGGGAYTTLQRSALFQMASDHVSSALDARESSFELHASGGLNAWRSRLRAWFPHCDELVNEVLRLAKTQMPLVNTASFRTAVKVERSLLKESGRGFTQGKT